MGYRPTSASEINLFKIETALKKINRGELAISKVSKDLNWRFGRLKEDNIGMYEELHPKYLTMARIA